VPELPTLAIAPIRMGLFECRHQFVVQRLRAGRRVWVVYAFPERTALSYPGIMDSVASSFDFIKRFPGTLGNGDVFVYRSRK